jgi:P27 family predicted phage terminase small subunit
MGRGGQGRPSKPSSLKVLHGDRKDRINDAEPVPDAEEVTAPAWIVAIDHEAEVGTETALDVWNRLAPDLVRKKVLTSWDVEAFATYCDAVVNHRRASEEVARDGVTVMGAKSIVRNPAVVAAKTYADVMARYGARFGLTPSDRASLSLGEGRRDPREDLLSG